MSHPKWPMVPLGEVVDHRKEFITIDDAQRYKRCRVQLHAKGVVLRDRVDGASIKTKSQQVCRANEFLVAEIDAKMGGFGLVPSELDGALVSSHYFLFSAKPNKLIPEFLGYYCRTPEFRDQVRARGTTNYAAIRPSHVLEYVLPLPPMEEQREIVRNLASAEQKLLVAAAHSLEQVRLVKALMNSTRRILIGPAPEGDWQKIGVVVKDIGNGWSPQCHGHPADAENWGVLKVGAVSFGRFDESQNKCLPVELPPRQELEIREGDFLMSRANTKELVGARALVDQTRSRLILCDKIFRFKFFDDARLNPAFLDHALKSPALRFQIEAKATDTSSTMKNISKSKILDLTIPFPCRDEQDSIVERLDALSSKIVDLQHEQLDVKFRREAILPSILDRAFKGEL